jgi:ATP-binding cassette, subfamily C (CFTR/MRP), member 1
MSAPRRETENELSPAAVAAAATTITTPAAAAAAAADEKPHPTRPSSVESDSDSVFDHEKTDGPVKKSTTHSTGYSGDSEQNGPAPENALERQKKWYKRLNPLKWGPIPPAPEKRSVSRELNASILSIITFQWMSPLMKVSLQ